MTENTVNIRLSGLFKSVISLVLITVGYWLADKFTGYKLF
jgi:putative aldouronate transport system permease protein